MTDATAPASAPPPKRTTLLIVILVAVGAVIVAIVAVFAFAGGDGDVAEPVDAIAAAGEPQQVRLEPISSATDPFAPPGLAGSDEAVTAVETPEPTTVEGGRVGLYGGTLDTAQCDKEQLATFLTEHPAEGAEWARIQEIAPEEMETYIDGLTPVLLRSDTAVTNHGFTNGVATPIQSVLQAGTAVLVDEYGAPVTKCYCGNPLRPPVTYTVPPGTTTTSTTDQATTTTNPTTTTTHYEPPTYYGPEWPTWNPRSITIIQVHVTIIEVYVLVDPTTGQTFERPRGTSGEADRPVDSPAESSTTTTVSPEATTTTTMPTNTTTTQPATTTTHPTTTTTHPTTTTTFEEPTPDCVDEFGNLAPCPDE